MGTLELLERIIAKGGIIGKCAERYRSNEKEAGQYILECSAHCQNFMEFWGEELIADIIAYKKQD
jgi:hypothetical protein